ncbi:hypothetical protein HLB35_16260 [Halomonas sp. TBZ9]|uniref:Mobilization protein n=1 Tax=Vreelandella azerica TaxID=2732867 RepID=A0A7Y3TZ64_9GAMM|nr:hypothetical protein [Halomonas azerica]NOG32936.1 hypothetical protein [Halomonas azerica]
MGVNSNLKQQLAEQFRQESATIHSATSEQLNAMQSELQSTYKSALRTIEADIQTESKALGRRFRHLMLLPSLLLVMISVAISAGAWAFTQYQYQAIQENRQTLLELDTSGVELIERNGTEYLLMPMDAKARQLESGQIYIEMGR